MKLHKIIILGAAALAGSVVYKLQQSFTEPGTDAAPGQNIYSSVAGPGSLARTIRSSSNARNAPADDGGDDPRTAIAPNNMGTLGGGGSGGITNNYGKAKRASATSSNKIDVIPEDLELIQAAAKGDKSKVERRLSFHVKVDSRDSLRRTPLMYASWNGYDDICNRLIAAGANPQFKDREGNNAFDFAAGRGLTDTLHFLLQRTKSTDDGHYMEYAQVIQATFAGDPARLPEGTAKITSINRINPEGQAPLHIVAGNGSIALMEIMIRRGAQVNIANNNRQSPLHWAAWNNRGSVVQMLIDKGAEIGATDLAGNTPLILAAQNGGTDAVTILLGKGADKYISNKDGKTASIVAEDSGFPALATLLK